VQIIRNQTPDKKNALTRAMLTPNVAAALAEATSIRPCACSPSSAFQAAFSSGNDLADSWSCNRRRRRQRGLGFPDGVGQNGKADGVRVDGIAVGIGTTLNLHCDLTFATPRTIFRTPFVDLGLVPEAGSSLIAPRLLGGRALFALLGLARPFAERAKAAGLIYNGRRGCAGKPVLAAASEIAAKPAAGAKIQRAIVMREPREELFARIRSKAAIFLRRLKIGRGGAAALTPSWSARRHRLQARHIGWQAPAAATPANAQVSFLLAARPRLLKSFAAQPASARMKQRLLRFRRQPADRGSRSRLVGKE